MPKNPLKIMKKCAIASFSSSQSNATGTKKKSTSGRMKKKGLYSSPMAPGHAKKAAKRNISGLRNQKRARSPSPELSGPCHQPSSLKRHCGTDDFTLVGELDPEADWTPCLAADGDSTKVVGYDGTVAVDFEAEEVEEYGEEWEDSLDNGAFCENMIRMSLKNSCEESEEWVPFRLRWLKRERRVKKRTCFHI